MAKLHSNQYGFSVVEVLLAAALFALLATGLIGAFVYGSQASTHTGDRTRAVALADEGLQAVRNISNAAYANVTAGTYGLVQGSGVWTLSGTSDTTGIYTRQIVVTSGGTNRINVSITVSWTRANGTAAQVNVATELTNWSARTASWATPVLTAGIVNAGYKVATQGTYAYVVKNSSTGPNFTIVNTATTTAPAVVGSLTITGTPTNITVSGNYAYVTTSSSSGELVIVNIANPASPSVASTYNASGSAGGLGVFVSGNYAYLSRAANSAVDELVIVNVTNPAAPTRTYGIGLNVAMNDVYVNGTTIYVVTNSGTQEVIRYTPILFGVTYTSTVLNLPGTIAATTIDGTGDTLFVGQATTFYAINGTTMASQGSVVLPGTITDVDYNSNGTYAYAGTSYASGELQVMNVSSLTTPTIAGSINMTGSVAINGVSYNNTQNIVVGVGTSSTQSTAVFSPN